MNTIEERLVLLFREHPPLTSILSPQGRGSEGKKRVISWERGALL
jgi:hypothetical protein